MTAAITVGPLTVARGERAQGWLPIPGTSIRLPLVVARGSEPGPTLLVTAGIHGGEYPGIEAAIRFARNLEPTQIRGSIIVVPIASPSAFQARLQYHVPEDGLNLNRQFPGRVTGTVSQRIAATIMGELAIHASAWVDLHGGDIHENLMPCTIFSQGGGPEVAAEAARLAAAFGIPVLVRSDSLVGGTYGAAAAVGIPAILTEAGDCGQLDPAMVEVNSQGLLNVARTLGILPGDPAPAPPTTLLTAFDVLTSAHSGCWYPAIHAGDSVVVGQRLGELRDYFGTTIAIITAPSAGVVIYRITSLAVDTGDPLVGLGY